MFSLESINQIWCLNELTSLLGCPACPKQQFRHERITDTMNKFIVSVYSCSRENKSSLTSFKGEKEVQFLEGIEFFDSTSLYLCLSLIKSEYSFVVWNVVIVCCRSPTCIYSSLTFSSNKLNSNHSYLEKQYDKLKSTLNFEQ